VCVIVYINDTHAIHHAHIYAGLRQELGEEKLGSSLEELGLAPSASLTVQVIMPKLLTGTVARPGC